MPVVEEKDAKFPREKLVGIPAQKKRFQEWLADQPDAPAQRNPKFQIKAHRMTSTQFRKLRKVLERDPTPIRTLERTTSPQELAGWLYSAITTHRYMQMKAEYQRRQRLPTGLQGAEPKWAKVVQAASAAFRAGGMEGLSERDLDAFLAALTRDPKILDAVTLVAGSAVAVEPWSTLGTRTLALGTYLPQVITIRDPIAPVVNVPDLCDEPISQGSFTKHIAKSFSLKVEMTVWCPTWTNPFRTCVETFTIAGASFSMGINVGYKVTCCGATVWGQGYAKGCATLLGMTFCAGCTGTVVGVAGVSRTEVSNGCNYGLGITATLQCKFGGITVFYASVSFGYVVNGPCPPDGACP